MDKFNRVRIAKQWFEKRNFFMHDGALMCTITLDKYTSYTRVATQEEKKALDKKLLYGHCGEVRGNDDYPRFRKLKAVA